MSHRAPSVFLSWLYVLHCCTYRTVGGPAGLSLSGLDGVSSCDLSPPPPLPVQDISDVRLTSHFAMLLHSPCADWAEQNLLQPGVPRPAFLATALVSSTEVDEPKQSVTPTCQTVRNPHRCTPQESRQAYRPLYQFFWVPVVVVGCWHVALCLCIFMSPSCSVMCLLLPIFPQLIRIRCKMSHTR